MKSFNGLTHTKNMWTPDIQLKVHFSAQNMVFSLQTVAHKLLDTCHGLTENEQKPHVME